MGAIGVVESEAGVKSASNTVKLEFRLLDPATLSDREQMEALDLILSAAEVRVDPLPEDMVTTRNVDGDGVEGHGWVGLRLDDKVLLGCVGECAEL